MHTRVSLVSTTRKLEIDQEKGHADDRRSCHCPKRRDALGRPVSLAQYHRSSIIRKLGASALALWILASSCLSFRHTNWHRSRSYDQRASPSPLASDYANNLNARQNTAAEHRDSGISSTSHPGQHQNQSAFAYAQYATDLDYLVNAVANFVELRQLGAAHDMVLIHPSTWRASNEEASTQAAAIANIAHRYPYIKLKPFELLSTDAGDTTWRDSLTKFHTFSLVQYIRVLAFDSDMLVLHNPDRIFETPPAPLAVPEAYWLSDISKDSTAGAGRPVLGSHIMLLQPSQSIFRQVMSEAASSGAFDMDIINALYRDTALLLPHREWALLTGEFRTFDHSRYLKGSGQDSTEWNPVLELSRAKFVHFSDWPLPKPWRSMSAEAWSNALPECENEEAESSMNQVECGDREVWIWLYRTYAFRTTAVRHALGLE